MVTPISGTFLNILRSLLPAPGADLGSFVSCCLLLLFFPGVKFVSVVKQVA